MVNIQAQQCYRAWQKVRCLELKCHQCDGFKCGTAPQRGNIGDWVMKSNIAVNDVIFKTSKQITVIFQMKQSDVFLNLCESCISRTLTVDGN